MFVCVCPATTSIPTKLSNRLSSSTCRLLATYKHAYTFIAHHTHTHTYALLLLWCAVGYALVCAQCGVDLFELIYNLAIWPVNAISFFRIGVCRLHKLFFVLVSFSFLFSFSFYFCFYV